MEAPTALCHTPESMELLRAAFREILAEMSATPDEVDNFSEVLPFDWQRRITVAIQKTDRIERLGELMSIANEISQFKKEENYNQIRDVFLTITRKLGFKDSLFNL